MTNERWKEIRKEFSLGVLRDLEPGADMPVGDWASRALDAACKRIEAMEAARETCDSCGHLVDESQIRHGDDASLCALCVLDLVDESRAPLTIQAAQARVRAWHEERGNPMPDDLEVAAAGDRYAGKLLEEAKELLFETEAGSPSLPKIAKECADVLFALLGVTAAYGIDLPIAFEVVADSNDTKTATRDAAGHIAKGEGYVPPDMVAVVERMRGRAST